MLRTTVFSLTVALCVALPSANRASADEGAASVIEVSMLLDARLNGKDVWSPGGREVQWTASKCPLRIQFKGQVLVDKPTKITYRWERSDGDKTETQTFDVKTANSLVDVTPPDAWSVGKSGQVFRGAATFHVLTPSDLSTSTPLRVDCP